MMYIKRAILIFVVITMLYLLFLVKEDSSPLVLDNKIVLDKKNAPNQVLMPIQNNINNNAIITLYFADWCGACKMYIPEWNRLKNIIQKDYPNISTVEINCEKNKDVCFAKKILGYPTISIKKNNENEYFYEKSRNSEDVIKEALS